MYTFHRCAKVDMTCHNFILCISGQLTRTTRRFLWRLLRRCRAVNLRQVILRFIKNAGITVGKYTLLA